MLLAVTWPDLQTMLNNIAQNIPPLEDLTRGVAFLVGMAFIFRSVHLLKEYGEIRTMMSSQTNFLRPATYFIVGTGLLFYPELHDATMMTFFNTAHESPIGYSSGTSADWSSVVTVVERIVQLVGGIAFVRGWHLMASLGNHSHPHGAFGKAMTHIIGGVLAMNIAGTVSVIQNTLGVHF